MFNSRSTRRGRSKNLKNYRLALVAVHWSTLSAWVQQHEHALWTAVCPPVSFEVTSTQIQTSNCRMVKLLSSWCLLHRLSEKYSFNIRLHFLLLVTFCFFWATSSPHGVTVILSIKSGLHFFASTSLLMVLGRLIPRSCRTIDSLLFHDLPTHMPLAHRPMCSTLGAPRLALAFQHRKNYSFSKASNGLSRVAAP